MFRISRSRLPRRALVVATAVGLLTLAGGVAYATIPDAAGVYTACKLKSTGTIRLIDPSLSSSSLLSHCTSLESQISWNQQGQQGPPGKDGAPGKDGPAGPQGVPGPQGDPGPNEVENGAPCSITGVPNGVLSITTNPDTTLTMRCLDPTTVGPPIPRIELTNRFGYTTGELAGVAVANVNQTSATDIAVHVSSSDPSVLSVVEDATIPAGHTDSNIIGLAKQPNATVTLSVTFAIGGPAGETINIPVETPPS